MDIIDLEQNQKISAVSLDLSLTEAAQLLADLQGLINDIRIDQTCLTDSDCKSSLVLRLSQKKTVHDRSEVI